MVKKIGRDGKRIAPDTSNFGRDPTRKYRGKFPRKKRHPILAMRELAGMLSKRGRARAYGRGLVKSMDRNGLERNLEAMQAAFTRYADPKNYLREKKIDQLK